VMGTAEPRMEGYVGAALVICGIAWIWDFVASIYFAGQMALNLTIISSLVYLEASFIGAFVLTRKLPKNQMLIGLRAGLYAFLINLAFRMILFELWEALWGVVIYFISFTIGGMLGGIFAKKIQVGNRPTEASQ
jgi:putative membrane protein (TIGR04086 family)